MTPEEIQKRLDHSLEVIIEDIETKKSFDNLVETMKIYEEELGYSMKNFREEKQEHLEFLKDQFQEGSKTVFGAY